jgi:hypothetical protein
VYLWKLAILKLGLASFSQALLNLVVEWCCVPLKIPPEAPTKTTSAKMYDRRAQRSGPVS